MLTDIMEYNNDTFSNDPVKPCTVTQKYPTLEPYSQADGSPNFGHTKSRKPSVDISRFLNFEKRHSHVALSGHFDRSKDNYSQMPKKETRGKSALSTSMLIGRYDEFNRKRTDLNTSCADLSYTKTRPSYLSQGKPSDHLRTVAAMERAVAKAVQGKADKKLEMLSVVFEEIIKVDPHYGKVLKEIKKAYDETFRTLKENKQAIPNAKIKTLEQEISYLRKENELLKKEKNSLTTELKTKLISTNYPSQITKNIAQEVCEKTESTEQTESSAKGTEKSIPRKKPMVPRLDLSKIKNKYAGEKVVIAQVKEQPTKKDSKLNMSMVAIPERKGILKEQSANIDKTKPKNLKEMSELYAELYKKATIYSKDGLGKFKKGIY